MKLIIDENAENQRIDAFLTELYPDLSRSKIQAEIKKGLTLVNSKPVKPSYVLKIGDIIEFIPPSVDVLSIEPENIPLDLPSRIPSLYLSRSSAKPEFHNSMSLVIIKTLKRCCNILKNGVIYMRITLFAKKKRSER